MAKIKICPLSRDIKVRENEIKEIIARNYGYFHIPRVIVIPRDHDYLHCLYNAMPEGALLELPLGIKLDPYEVDILHIHWPGYLVHYDKFIQPGSESEHMKFIKAIGRSRIRVVWTMHNRLPHGFATEWSRRLYRTWAAVADGVIHHSNWGMGMMRGELPYKSNAKHVVIPVGHYKEQMSKVKSRNVLEKEMQLSPCKMRFGVIGRPQKDKQVPLIIRAFFSAARDDQQLLVTAITKDMDLPDDPRIIPIYRKRWLSREEIARQVLVCDALVCAHSGPTYLTSGLVSDAVGAGIPMLVGEWGFFREIMGEAAFYFDGTEQGLTRLFGKITIEDIEAGKRDSTALQHDYSWSMIAKKTLRLFKKLHSEKLAELHIGL